MELIKKTEDKWITQRELDAWGREQEALFKPEYCMGNKEFGKSFNQKRVICFQGDSVYAFGQCRHQCMCESCY